jgi:hypothetical protein
MAARLRVVDVFQITNRGRVVAGDILEGVVRIGMVAAPEDQPTLGSWTIAGVEFVDNVAPRESQIALVLGNGPSVDALRALVPPGTVLAIRDPNTDVAA